MKKNSFSLRMSLKFMMVLASSVLILSCAIVVLIYFFVRTEQNHELRDSAIRVEKIVTENRNPSALKGERPDFADEEKRGDGKKLKEKSGEEKKDEEKKRPSDMPPGIMAPDFSRVPYYVNYVVTSVDSGFTETVFTNEPDMPVLPETSFKVKTYLVKDFHGSRNLRTLYLTKKSSDGKYLVQVSLDMERDISSHLLDKIPPAIAIAVLPILVLSFFISLLIAHNTMVPVVRLTKSAEQISLSNLGMLLPRTDNGDEIDSLAATFNSLFERLKKDYEREKSFTSDVSHELKTPVAVILGQSNLLLRWGKDDPVQLQKSLESIKGEAKSMEAIISNLLQISRLENGKIQHVFSSVDLNSMFRRIVEEFLAVAPDVDFVVDDDESISIVTDSELLHQVLTVVVSNSVKFCGKKCTIKLGWKQNDGAVTVFVEDDGQGFSEDVLPNVFQRFYRGDEAHARSAGGAGLGLSIAKTIVENLGGKISAYNCTPHGAGISVDLPLGVW